MRIIAGSLRGRRILWPRGEVTRPITDRVKQSLFDILTPLLPGARVYDLFSGAGSLGLESLSRGAEHVTFFEADRPALAVLSRNLKDLNLAGQSRIISGDLFAWFSRAGVAEKRADIVFLDPPYRMLREMPDALRRLTGHIADRHLAADGVVVFRHERAD